VRGPARRAGAAGCALALAVWLATPPALAQRPASAALPPPGPGALADTQPGASRFATPLLREGVRLDLQGRHDAALDVWERMRAQDPTDPAPVVFETNTLYWIMVYDDEDTRHDDRIAALCDEAIALARARVEADDADPDAHFLLGHALMNRGRLHGWRGRYYKAGRDGEEARAHLERAVALRPGFTDARYHLGLYYFYASLIPQLVTRWLGWLWFVPTGNAEEGIAFVADVAHNGDVFRDEARFMLANIYTYHSPEKREEALRLMAGVAERYPENVLIRFELIEALYENGLVERTIAEADRLAAHAPRTRRERGRVVMAPVWKARAEILRDHPERALETLAPYLAAPPERPLWGTAWIDLVRGHAFDALGRRDEAIVLYERVIAREPPRRSRRAARLAKEAIESPYEPPRPTELRPAP
jgi:tetratricopeptide (TPR) repeat protein